VNRLVGLGIAGQQVLVEAARVGGRRMLLRDFRADLPSYFLACQP
jgi:hypothetical protein